MSLANVHPKKVFVIQYIGQNYRKSGHGQLSENLVPSFLRPIRHHFNGDIKLL